MGIGLCEYRAAIGAFAWIAANTGRQRKSKSKTQKSSRLRGVNEEERCEKGQSSCPGQVRGKRFVSLGGWKTRSISDHTEKRSRSLNKRKERNKSSQPVGRRESCVQRRRKPQNVTSDSFKNSCIACKTILFDQKSQRGRAGRKITKQCNGTNEDRNCSRNDGRLSSRTINEETRTLYFLTSIAASGCLLMEQAIFTIVQILLVRSGVETNPGPTSQTCCLAYQHFKRVKNTIEKAQNNFKSKITDDTLTKKVIEIEETGRVFNIFFL